MAEEGAAKQHFSVWLLVPEPQRSTIAAAMKAAADAHGLPTSEPHITLLGDAGAGTEAEMTTKLAALAGIGAVPINFAKSGAVTAGIGTDGTAPWNQSAVAVPALTPELIATANVGCQLHLQTGCEQPVRHWIELLDAETDLLIQ